MTAISPITVQAVKDVGLAAPIIASVVTFARLFERIRKRKFGFDDGFAALSLALLWVFVAGLFVHLGDPTHLSYTTRVGMYYVLSQGFYGVIWTARLSILFSVIRITPPSNVRQMLYGLVGTFVLVWAILFAQVFWVCELEPDWKESLTPQCALGRNVAIAQLISAFHTSAHVSSAMLTQALSGDIYADFTLIVAPLRLLWNLGVSRSQKNRLILVFSSSIVTSVASLIHAYYVLRVGGLDEVFVAIIEICVSLLVCNLAVIVGLVSRIVEKHSGKSHGLGGVASRPIEFVTTRTVDDGLNVKVVELKSGPFSEDPTYPKQGGKSQYPDHPYHGGYDAM
ncbi:hypothetical protein C0991_001376 [Blastosporella zonata]|nr:hypothetical protein C0991_001376 [Blastosporella zonata]